MTLSATFRSSLALARPFACAYFTQQIPGRALVSNIRQFAVLNANRHRRVQFLSTSVQAQAITEESNHDSATRPSFSRSEIRKMRVGPLREKLASRGLSTEGIKNDLVARLIEDMEDSSVSGPASSPTDDSNKTAGCPPQLDPDRTYVLRIRAHAPNHAGETGVGMVLYDQEDVREVWVARKYFFVVQTRFQAEYRGLALALRYIRQQGVRKLVVQTDNKVILEQLDGKYQVRKAQLKQLYWTAISLKETFDEFTTTPIAAIENSRAGNLARRAVATRKSFGIEGLEHPPTNSHKESTSTLSEEVNFSPDETYLLRFDGASRGNPGSAGAGMVIYGQDGKELWCGCKYVGNNNTNNEAEYTAVLMGLKCAVSLGITKLIVEGDSILVVRQLLGEYRVKSGKLEGLYAASKTIIDHHLQSCEIRHIARNENTRADELANHAVDTKQSYGFEEEE